MYPYFPVIIFCTENNEDKRRFLLRAVDKGMADGSYVFFLPYHLQPPNVETPWIGENQDDEKAKLMYSHTFQVIATLFKFLKQFCN